ncbi:sensor histidine kinase [Dactylosporangium darangshiense]|uniref:histidine kinase n=1 Tax=Dactylosporangium darangshiense TaxID=579108 RepID=A0ABP8CXJ9_9ACTN
MRLVSWLVRPTPPPLPVGIAVCALFVVAETLIVYPLGRVARADELAVVYMIGVLAVSMIWGFRLAVVTSVASALAFHFFHVPPVGKFSFADNLDWFELAVFIAVALLVSSMARLARSRAVESVQRRREADLIAGLAQLMLGSNDLASVLPEASRRLAQALELPYAQITLESVAGDERRAALPLRGRLEPGTLLVPADLPEPTLRRLRDQVVPALDALLSAAHDGELMSISLRTSRDELRAPAEEQAALRRVATLVGRGVAPSEIFAAVAMETARLLDADASRLLRYEAPGTVTVIAEFSKPGVETLLGRRLAIAGGATEMVYRTSRPARVDTYQDRAGPLAALARDEGLHSSVAAPILVDGRLWGTMVVLWARHEAPPAGAEYRLAEFTELLATAVGNAESRAELTASRARIVVAADDARRRIERDLHDGVQQRLVALGLDLRAAEALVPQGLDELKARLSDTTDGLTGVFKDLQEIARGIHPAILSQGGLGPALKALALRCPIPVELNLGTQRRLPERVEVAAYYIVSEALTNATKHAHASAIVVDVETRSQMLVLSIRDNGIGGADPRLGSGLVGLADRVEALGGHLHVASPLGGGTSLRVELPSAEALARLPEPG